MIKISNILILNNTNKQDDRMILMNKYKCLVESSTYKQDIKYYKNQ